jgi:hypothetical protein
MIEKDSKANNIRMRPMDSQRRLEREAFIDWGARGQTGKCYGNLEI